MKYFFKKIDKLNKGINQDRGGKVMFSCLRIPYRQKNSTALSTKENPPNQSKPDKKKPVKIEEIEGHNVNMATHYDPHFVFRTTSVTCLYQRFHLHGYLQPAKKEETVVYIHEKPASPSPSTTSPASSSPSPSPSATSPASS